MESVERQMGKRPAALDGPPCPADGEHIWKWFIDLASCRTSNGFGGNPITWLDIAAWSGLTGIIVRPSEIEAIMAIDRAYLVDQDEQMKKG